MGNEKVKEKELEKTSGGYQALIEENKWNWSARKSRTCNQRKFKNSNKTRKVRWSSKIFSWSQIQGHNYL